MTDNKECILIFNAGSSSIKFALFQRDESLTRSLYGKLDRITSGAANLSYADSAGNEKQIDAIEIKTYSEVVNYLLGWLGKEIYFKDIKIIGHRIVHGMNHTEPEIVTEKLLKELNNIISFAPDHLPLEIEFIKRINERYPSITQLACFDTSFHTTMPDIARLMALPRRFKEKNIRRYGFHGISCSYLIEELLKQQGTDLLNDKIILAHLGNGASLTAVMNGKSIDTSMGFTPASGLPMGSRSGDIDPGLVSYIMQAEKLSIKEFDHLINHESGLLGISGTSSDMRDLIKTCKENIHAEEAIDFFCYQIRKWIGAYTAVLGGLDTLVFSGGIGENLPDIRKRICKGLNYLGIELDEKLNSENSNQISLPSGRVKIKVIRTNEELMVARMAFDVLKDNLRYNKTNV
jgi:acetate kinase